MSWNAVMPLSRSSGTWLGVSDDGEWLVGRSAEGPGKPAAPAGWVWCFPLLERPYGAVAEELEARRFPYASVVVAAMASGSDYWAGLALARAEEIPADPAIGVAARRLADAPWASQATRHRARRRGGHGPRDLYAEAHQLADALERDGRGAAAERIRDVIDGGSTSSEILFGLRSELDRMVASDTLPTAIREHADELRAAIASLPLNP